MSEKLKELLSAAKKVELTPADKEEQRRSFAYGNAKIENPRITRDTVDEEAEKLKKRA
jgi:hypothetical protein